MIDTIKIYIPISEIPSNYYDTHIVRFDNRRITKTDSGDKWVFCTHRNLRIHYNNRGLSIEGSLSKYKYGSNQYTLNLNDFIEVIDNLCFEFGLPLKECKVTRIDLAENIFTVKSVEHYYKYLGEIKSLSRVKMNNGIEYRNGNRAICFYNKVKELKHSGDIVSKIFDGKNVLRYEYRLQNNVTISKILNVSSATVDDVINGHQNLIREWLNTFIKIYKNHDLISFRSEAYSDSQGIEKQLMIAGINSLGGIQNILEIIKEARKNKVFKYPNRATSLTRKIKDLMHTPVLTERSKLIYELEGKIKLAGFLSTSYEYLWRT